MSEPKTLWIHPPQNLKEEQIFLEQYKLLIESINKSNEIRETSNNFWITVNTLGVSAIAYVRDTQHLMHMTQKPLALWGMIVLGMVVCFAWISFLRSIKHSIEIRNNLLMELEKFCPIKIFTMLMHETGRQKGRQSLTAKETIIPFMFIIFYSLYGFLILFFP